MPDVKAKHRRDSANLHRAIKSSMPQDSMGSRSRHRYAQSQTQGRNLVGKGSAVITGWSDSWTTGSWVLLKKTSPEPEF